MLRQTDIITDITASPIGRALILMNSNPNPITDITASPIGRALILMNSNPNPITDITASHIERASILMNSNSNPITDISLIDFFSHLFLKLFIFQIKLLNQISCHFCIFPIFTIIFRFL